MAYTGKNPKFTKVTASTGFVGEIASGADSNTTLTSTSVRIQSITPTAARTYTLPTTGVVAGDVFTVANNAAVSSSNLFITVNSSAGNAIRTVYPQTTARFMATQATPTTSAHWYCLDAAITEWSAFTPAGTWNNSTYTGFWRRDGDSLEVRVRIVTTGTPTDVALATTVPMSLSIDTTKCPITAGPLSYNVGTILACDAGTQYYHGIMLPSTSTSILTLIYNASSTYVNGTSSASATLPFSVVSGDHFYMHYKIPISGWTTNKG